MKCISYISRIEQNSSGTNIPTDLGSIYIHARRANIVKKITGVISYTDGFYFQVIEGDNFEIDELYKKILTDPRHSAVKELIHTTINRRIFKDWSMKLVIAKGEELTKFNDIFSSRIASLDQSIFSLYKKFVNIQDNNAVQVESSVLFNGSLLKLNGWPDFNSFKPSPIFIDMCAKLINSACTYESLLAAGISEADTENINSTLVKLHALGLLEVITSTDENHSKASPPENTQTKETSFYSKMANFLRARL